MDAEKFIEMLEDVIETRSYSGRGMFGESCVAFECDRGREIEIIVNLMSEATTNYEPEIMAEFANTLRLARIDDMGLGTIVYFPRMKHPDSVKAEKAS